MKKRVFFVTSHFSTSHLLLSQSMEEMLQCEITSYGFDEIQELEADMDETVSCLVFFLEDPLDMEDLSQIYQTWRRNLLAAMPMIFLISDSCYEFDFIEQDEKTKIFEDECQRLSDLVKMIKAFLG